MCAAHLKKLVDVIAVGGDAMDGMSYFLLTGMGKIILNVFFCLFCEVLLSSYVTHSLR